MQRPSAFGLGLRPLAYSLTLITFVMIAAGCSRAPDAPKSFDNTKPVVINLATTPIASPSNAAAHLAELKAKRQAKAIAHRLAPQARMNFVAEPAVSGEVTLAKAQIMGRMFLYGSDLQYSSFGDEDGMYLQTLALGHTPAEFKILGDRLQLIADQKHLFDSDINHPGRLINEFPIVRQDNETVTIAIRSASPLLASLAEEKAPAPRATWVRSLNFVADGNYLLIETSVEYADGKVAEFMESLFPRETLVPSKFDPILADPEREPLAERFRFLSETPVYLALPDGRVKTKVAERFHVEEGTTIDWYVTPNIPAKYIPLVKMGVEGWNRYSQKMWNRDFVRFVGVLPDGVKVGDPRYNVINWDSVPDASSAYESQAVDPLTGIQSHSLIYLPYAWIKIGEEYWTSSALTQDDSSSAKIEKILKRGSFMGRDLKVNCLHDAAMSASLEAHRSVEAFAHELLKQVLFHEMGHALGLSHNFKGSLSFDPDNKESAFSSSIMDYNQYQLEDTAFSSLDSSDGRLFEYDRQIISVLYNGGKDIAESDPVLPACDDEEADSMEDGVDPVCIRYDAGADPTQQLVRSIALTTDANAKLGKTKSLPVALQDTLSVLGEPSSATSPEEVAARTGKLLEQLRGVILYYYGSGAQSVAYMTRANIRSLYVYREATLPQTLKAGDMSARVAQSLLHVASLATLDQPVKEAFNDVVKTYGDWLAASSWYQSLPADKQEAAAKALPSQLTLLSDAIEKTIFPKVRASVLGSLKRVDTAPFYFSTTSVPATDYERFSLEVLENALTQPLNGELRPVSERLAIVGALLSFKDVEEGNAVIERVTSKVKSELPRARNAAERESLRKLLKALNG